MPAAGGEVDPVHADARRGTESCLDGIVRADVRGETPPVREGELVVARREPEDDFAGRTAADAGRAVVPEPGDLDRGVRHADGGVRAPQRDSLEPAALPRRVRLAVALRARQHAPRGRDQAAARDLGLPESGFRRPGPSAQERASRLRAGHDRAAGHLETSRRAELPAAHRGGVGSGERADEAAGDGDVGAFAPRSAADAGAFGAPDGEDFAAFDRDGAGGAPDAAADAGALPPAGRDEDGRTGAVERGGPGDADGRAPFDLEPGASLAGGERVRAGKLDPDGGAGRDPHRGRASARAVDRQSVEEQRALRRVHRHAHASVGVRSGERERPRPGKAQFRLDPGPSRSRAGRGVLPVHGNAGRRWFFAEDERRPPESDFRNVRREPRDDGPGGVRLHPREVDSGRGFQRGDRIRAERDRERGKRRAVGRRRAPGYAVGRREKGARRKDEPGAVFRRKHGVRRGAGARTGVGRDASAVDPDPSGEARRGRAAAGFDARPRDGSRPAPAVAAAADPRRVPAAGRLDRRAPGDGEDAAVAAPAAADAGAVRSAEGEEPDAVRDGDFAARTAVPEPAGSADPRRGRSAPDFENGARGGPGDAQRRAGRHFGAGLLRAGGKRIRPGDRERERDARRDAQRARARRREDEVRKGERRVLFRRNPHFAVRGRAAEREGRGAGEAQFAAGKRPAATPVAVGEGAAVEEDFAARGRGRKREKGRGCRRDDRVQGHASSFRSPKAYHAAGFRASG